jgi:hypothetical protein
VVLEKIIDTRLGTVKLKGVEIERCCPPCIQGGRNTESCILNNFSQKKTMTQKNTTDNWTVCCLCGEDIISVLDSNNPWPLSEDEEDRCCGDCNNSKVIPARLKLFFKNGNTSSEVFRLP